MKKYIFRSNNKELKEKGKYLLGVVIALLIAYIVYPSFSLTKVDYNCKVVDKLGSYTRYSFDNRTYFNKKGIDSHEIGEMSTIKIKLKDHANYEDDSSVNLEITLIAVYTILMIVLFGTYLGMYHDGYEFSKVYTGFLWTSVFSITLILILWWI